jgi:hypothetical protein
MRNNVKTFIDAVDAETDYIDELIDAIRDQREAISEHDTEAINDIMNDTRDIFFDAQTADNIRSDLSKRLAAEFMCEPKASSLSGKMQEDERIIFNGTVDRLTQSIFVLKSEMMILTGLIEQSEKYTSMMLSELQRLSGDNSYDFSQSGGADFRG